MTLRFTKQSIVRFIACSTLPFVFARAGFATDYFVSPDGNDANAGTSVSTPWRKIAKANDRARAGDTIYLRGGEYVDDPIAPTASGSSENPITYTAYQSERPVLTSYAGLPAAITLRDVSHIIVEKLAIDGRQPAPAVTLERFAVLTNAVRVEIRDCDFRYADGWGGIELTGDSQFNRIVRNRIDFVGEYDRDGEDYGDAVYIEWSAHHNLIASNFVSRGAHDVMRTKGHSNVVQDNVLDNDWSDVAGPGTGGHIIILDGSRNVFQRNVVRGAGQSIDSLRNPGMKVEGTGNIARMNLIMDNHDVAIASETGYWQEFAQDNRIYNNTIYNNGGAAWRVRFYENENWPRGNVFKNNLVYRNRQDPGDSVYDTDFWILLTGSGFNAPGTNIIVNNLVAQTRAGDARVHLDPPFAIVPLANAESSFPNQIGGNIQAVPAFVKQSPVALGDFELAPGSPGIDAAAPLTTTTVAGSGSTVPVADASYFSDGHGLIAGDVLKIGSERNVMVLGVDVTANRLTIDREISWTGGAAVNLEFQGGAPDIGAVESGLATQWPVAPRAPVLNGVIVK